MASQSAQYFAAGDVRSLTSVLEVAGTSRREDWNFDYDPQHQLVAASGPSYETLMTYTPGGRIDSVYVDGPPEVDRDLVYQYNDAAAGDPETVARLEDRATHAAVGSFEWDAAGNQTAKTDRSGTMRFRYDGAGHLRVARRQTAGGTARELYWYAPTGQRVLALTLDGAGAPSQVKLWFGDAEIHYRADGQVATTHAYLPGPAAGRIVDRTRAELTFHNALGHLLAATDDTGRAVAGFAYSPYGEVIETRGDGAASFRRRFNGKESDAATGLAYYGALQPLHVQPGQSAPVRRSRWAEPRRRRRARGPVGDTRPAWRAGPPDAHESALSGAARG